MRTARILIPILQAIVLLGFALAIRNGLMPLGVRGEWEWLRLPKNVSTTWLENLTGFGGLLVYAALLGFGYRRLMGKTSYRREALWVAGLLVSAVVVQVVLHGGAPVGYGLHKWGLALSNPGSSGYYSVAKKQIRDPERFFAEYAEWIKKQDSLHVGTHPPGLLFAQRHLLDAMESYPGLARGVLDLMPPSVDMGLNVVGQLPRADRATLAFTGCMTMLFCAATVVPLYLLARTVVGPPVSWAVASIWPLLPSVILFQPAADTAFPFLSTSAFALAAYAARSQPRNAILLAIGSGIVLGVGMCFTLAYLPVGLIVGIQLAAGWGQTLRMRVANVLATGVGFLAVTLLSWWVWKANPFVIWWWNQRNHGRFYVEYPRTYSAWVVENPIELAIGIGLPVALWGLIALRKPRQIPLVTWATLGVLVFLTLGGKNLSEVARLWIPLMPPLLLAMGQGMAGVGAGAKSLATTALLVGFETLLLEMTIQVVYPI
ncbi:hypothetical protein [Singulisphaera sp. PoT]|uniref:hypothetical protein n=1 Tax=Singulisphaera sp. PoT TaxID=3411797 RepID=UPI003BF60D21